MASAELLRAAGGDMTQMFPLSTAGKTDSGATSGDDSDGIFSGVVMLACTADGSVNITFSDGTTCTKAFTEGMDRSFPLGATIEITSGTFDIA